MEEVQEVQAGQADGLLDRDSGFYRDGRFADLNDVVEHYSRVLRLSLSEAERADLVQFLKSL